MKNNSKPFYKKWWGILILIFIILIFLGMLIPKSQTPQQIENKIEPEPKKVENTVIANRAKELNSTKNIYSASSLAIQFKKEQKIADKIYKDKEIFVKGKIRSFEKISSGTDTLCLAYLETNIDYKIVCQIDNSEDINLMKKDKEVILKGLCKGVYSNVEIRECKIYKIEK